MKFVFNFKISKETDNRFKMLSCGIYCMFSKGKSNFLERRLVYITNNGTIRFYVHVRVCTSVEAKMDIGRQELFWLLSSCIEFHVHGRVVYKIAVMFINGTYLILSLRSCNKPEPEPSFSAPCNSTRTLCRHNHFNRPNLYQKYLSGG